MPSTAALDAAGPVTPGTADQSKGSGATPVIHGDKWAEPTDRRGPKQSFKETWVYVDGKPIGALRYPELPFSLPAVWKDDVESLDFKPGDKGPRERAIQVLRWRLSDYLRVVGGVDLKKIKYVYIHGNGVVAIDGNTFRKHAAGITFNFTGNDFSKTRFFWPTDMKTNTAYDRYVAVSVFVEKPPMTLDRHNNPYIDGVEVSGIPYYGVPLRGGFRVYLDDKLVHIIKRNELGAGGRSNPEDTAAEPAWDLVKLLKHHGITADPVAADLVIARDLLTQKRIRLDESYVRGMIFKQTSESSGGLLLGKDGLSGAAIMLYSKGKVPPDQPLTPLERVAQPTPASQRVK